MRREAKFGNTNVKILRKSRREEREMMWQIWDREKGISGMILPQKKKKRIAKIGRLIKEKKKTELWQK